MTAHSSPAPCALGTPHRGLALGGVLLLHGLVLLGVVFSPGRTTHPRPPASTTLTLVQVVWPEAPARPLAQPVQPAPAPRTQAPAPTPSVARAPARPSAPTPVTQETSPVPPTGTVTGSTTSGAPGPSTDGGPPGSSGTSQGGAVAPPALQAGRPDYAHNPPPDYPLVLREQGVGGTVWLRVWVEHDGRPGEVRLHKGSGYRLLDDAALRAVRHWRFIPARLGPHSQASWVEFPIRFALQS